MSNINKMMQTKKKAIELMKSGESSLKTHIFKWNPNYLEATPKFMEASSMLENVGEYARAITCYEKLALCYEKQDDLFGAADSYQKIAFIILMQRKDPETAYQYLTKSVNLFKIHGNTLKSQEMLKKLAKRCFDQGHDDLGAKIYREIIDDIFDDQNYGTGSEVITEYLNFLIEKERYQDAIQVYMSHIKYLQSVKKYDHLVARAWLSIISIHIIMGEYYVADEKMGTFGASIAKVSGSDEYSAALSMLDAIQKGDDAAFIKVLRRPIFSQIEASLLRKLKKYTLPKKEEVKKAANPLFGSAEVKKQPHPQEEVKGPAAAVPGAVPGHFVGATEPLEEIKAEPGKSAPAAVKEEPVPQASAPVPVQETKPELAKEEKKEGKNEEKKEEKKPEPEPEPVPVPVTAPAEKKTEESDYGGMFK